jgi:hypothetical protein
LTLHYYFLLMCILFSFIGQHLETPRNRIYNPRIP